MSESRNPLFDILSEAVKSIQKCLQCSICLDMLSTAVKTKCGHSFCRPCLKPVLNRRHPKCPLCNNIIQKRHIKKNLHIQKYINHFNHLVRAVRQDTNIDILSYTRFPQNTREACTTSNRQRRSRASATVTRGNRSTIGNTPVNVERNPIPLEEQPSTSRQAVEGERNNMCREQKNNTKKIGSTNETRRARRLVVTEDTSGIITRQWRRQNVSSTNSTTSRQQNRDAEKIPTDNETVKKTQQSDKKSMDTVDLSEITEVGKSSTIPEAIPSSSKSFQVENIVTTNKMNVKSSLSETSKFQVSPKTNKNEVQVCHQNIFKTYQTAHNRGEGESSSLNENEKSLESQSNFNTDTVRTSASTSRQNQLKDMCLIWSNLTANQVDSVKQLSSMLSIKWTKKFNPTVTHVIVGINNNTVTKTLKFLQGMAYKKFVIGFNWVTDCLKEKTIVNEEPYEVINFCTPKATPPRSRHRENFFNGFTFLCIEPFRSITVNQFEDLLKALGATIVQTMDDFITAKEKYKIILVQSGVHTDEIIASWYKEIKAIIISSNWVVECISQYKLIPCYTYLHEIVEKDILSLTYPKQMIELF